MTDQPPVQPPDEPAEKPTAHPGGGAARRARRIGGRPLPAAASGAEPAEPAEPADETVTETATETVTGRAASAERVTVGVPAPEVPAREVPAREIPARETRAREVPAWLLWLPAGVLAAACVVLVVFGVLASHGVWWGKDHVDVAQQRGQVLAAAKTCMATMNSYDYRKLDQAEAQGLACTTGKLTGQYKQAMEKLIKPQAAKVQFTQTAQVNNAGIEQISPNGRQWTVLIFGQLSTTNSQTGASTPKLSVFSARVTMQEVDGRWLVANYQYAPVS